MRVTDVENQWVAADQLFGEEYAFAKPSNSRKAERHQQIEPRVQQIGKLAYDENRSPAPPQSPVSG